MSKGRDVMLGPSVPEEESGGYGFQWVLIHEGRVDALMTGVWNIARIRTAKIKMFHQSDPFPADGLVAYPKHDISGENVTEEHLRKWRMGALARPSRTAMGRGVGLDHPTLEQMNPRFKGDAEAFVLHMLRRELGDQTFRELTARYLERRLESGEPVATTSFQKLAEDIGGRPLDWFFDQWVNGTTLPRLALKEIKAEEEEGGWRVRGRILDEGGGAAAFRFPVELELITENGSERHEVWMDAGSANIDLRSGDEPNKLTVDPDYELLKIQRMPPRLWWYWHVCPETVLVYGTVGEAEANRGAAERLNEWYLGYGQEAVQADVRVRQEDLETKCIMLFGRPSTNAISHRLEEVFPVQFQESAFSWSGTTYTQPTQGVAQIVESPFNPARIVILYAGLSGEATMNPFAFGSGKLEIDDGWYPHESDASYYIFDGFEKLASGDWEEYDRDLVWDFRREGPR
jgi:hypothetical protein